MQEPLVADPVAIIDDLTTHPGDPAVGDGQLCVSPTASRPQR